MLNSFTLRPGLTYLGGEPVVELRDPVVQRVDGDNAQHLLGGRILQEHVDERDDLNKKLRSEITI